MGYSKGTILIPSVTGDVTIFVTAERPLACTNVARTGIDKRGAIYNGGLGYKDDTDIDSSGNDRTNSRFTATGFIAIAPGVAHILRFGGTVQPDWNEYGHSLCTYDKNFNLIKATGYSNWATGGNYVPNMSSEDGCTYRMDLPVGLMTSNVAYIRVSVKTTASGTAVTGGGEGLIIALDQSIY